MYRDYPIDPMYMVNKKGDVLSKYTGKQLKPSLLANGYYHVNVRNGEGKRVPASIHRMVGITFLPAHQGRNHINHKDGNKLNNCIENLEWCTNLENRQHAVSQGAHAFGSNHGLSKLTEREVHFICALFVSRYSIPDVIRLFQKYYSKEVSRPSLLNIRGRRTWRHVGDQYCWPKFNTANKRSKRATTISEESTPK